MPAFAAAENTPERLVQVAPVDRAFAIPGCPAWNPVCSNPVNEGRFGNSGLNILAGPPVRNMDFALLKYFSLAEKARLQFRMSMSTP